MGQQSITAPLNRWFTFTLCPPNGCNYNTFAASCYVLLFLFFFQIIPLTFPESGFSLSLTRSQRRQKQNWSKQPLFCFWFAKSKRIPSGILCFQYPYMPHMMIAFFKARFTSLPSPIDPLL